ncbi:hypothetical protein QFC21_005291 [Naganishia friedmannii]|uniref:Uncharacterized protein n=1 Tax=Naganishia friedmannii TaxID=89922 RepID=A0ACC2VBB7_9TREE|nr:hypothetical protein QFC21_005291 [Naganishia friedmannii]
MSTTHLAPRVPCQYKSASAAAPSATSYIDIDLDNLTWTELMLINAGILIMGLFYLFALLAARIQQEDDMVNARDAEEGFTCDKAPNLYRPAPFNGSSGSSTNAEEEEVQPLLVVAT